MESTDLVKLKKQYNEAKNERDSVATLLGYHTAGILHKALALYDNALAKKIFSLEYDIKEEEKRIKHIPKRLKELIGKKIKVTSVYDEYFKDAVGKIGTVLDVKRDELGEQWVLEVDIHVVEMLDRNGNSCYPNFRLFIGDDRYRTVKAE